MPVTVGSGEFTYEALESWQQLPPGVTLTETPGVAVNSEDRVYALTRNTAHPVQWLHTQSEPVLAMRKPHDVTDQRVEKGGQCGRSTCS